MDSVLIALRSGESVILQTYARKPSTPTSGQKSWGVSLPSLEQEGGIRLQGPWKLSFTESFPTVTEEFTLSRLQTWESIPNDSLRSLMGTGIYTTHLKLTKKEAGQHWLIDLGDVRESARVYINNVFVGCAWAVPFVLDCQDALQTGDNEIRIEVTNLPANRIAEMDRQGIPWRKFNEINIVDINYKKTGYENWAPMPSGLNSAVRLIPVE